MKANQVLTMDVNFSDEPLNVDAVPGLRDAVEEVKESKERQFVRCDGRVCDYDVYFNTKTDAVRIAALAPGASYEVTDDTSLSDFNE